MVTHRFFASPNSVQYEYTILATGTTSSTWYALGREADIAVSLPQYAGGALVQITELIEDNVPAS